MHVKLFVENFFASLTFYTIDLLGRKDKAIKPKKAPAEMI